MIFALSSLLLFSLVWALTSFGFVAAALTTLIGQPSDISHNQLYGVTVVSAASTVVALGLAVLIAMHLLGKFDFATRRTSQVLIAIGVIFCGVAIYSFSIAPSDHPADFFRRFVNNARFEFLYIGAASLIMSLRKA